MMPFGTYSGPDKPDKGQKHGSCNRRSCQDSPADWFNHGSRAWYCSSCREEIEFDSFNWWDWNRNFYPECRHPMFETEAMMEARK